MTVYATCTKECSVDCDGRCLDLCPGCGRSVCRCPSLEDVPPGQWHGDRVSPGSPGKRREPPADQPVEPEAAPARQDVAAFLAGGLPPPVEPVLLRRQDGHALFYAGKVNVLYGDPECGKTWIALAAVVEALNDGRRASFVDLDHNGMAEIVGRLLLLGAKPADLGDRDLFWLTEPEDKDELMAEIGSLRQWRPAAAVVDSLGELLPMLGLSSNSPDDYTIAHRAALTPLAAAGAAVIGIDHMPKSEEARQRGQTGTTAKKRAVNGITLRVTLHETFAPGKGGSANMTITKDRPGGLRAHCPLDVKVQPAGRFVMQPLAEGGLLWKVTTPTAVSTTDRLISDIAELDALDPPPRSQKDVQKRCSWGSDRAMEALRAWRDLQEREDEP